MPTAAEMPCPREPVLISNVPQFFQLIGREIALVGQGGVKARGAVALREHEPVPAGAFGVLGVHMQLVKVKIGEEIR